MERTDDGGTMVVALVLAVIYGAVIGWLAHMLLGWILK